MAKFRAKKSSKSSATNLAGGIAFKESPELELVSLLLTSFLKDKFYESSDEQLERLKQLVKVNKNKEFVAKAAVFARTNFGMRSITHALIGELTQGVKGKDWLKRAVAKAIYRPDDALEILGYTLSQYGKPIPNSLKKGISFGLQKFNAYQLGKYRGEKSDLSLQDLFNLVHPKPKKEMESVYKQIIEGKLKSKDTWEKNISEAGEKAKGDDIKKAKLKKKAWAALIKENKLGYFALLRNLRNILKDSPEALDIALKQLVDEKAIKSSLVLPFRFITALKELESEKGSKKIVNALSDALEISLSNVPKFDGKTLVVLDESGSMDGSPMEIGSLFAAMLYKTNDADLVTFSNNARFQNPNSRDACLTISNNLAKGASGGGTNLNSVFDILEEKYDRIIILSDCQSWMENGAFLWSSSPRTANSAYNAYAKKTGAKAKIFSFDLNGHGTLEFPENNVYFLAGWSDKCFDLMKILDEDRNGIVKKINSIEL